MTPDLEGVLRFDQAMVGVDLAGGILADHPIGPMTTYRAGGRAARFVRPVDRSELEAVAAGVASAGIPVLVVGRGLVLVADLGRDGLGPGREPGPGSGCGPGAGPERGRGPGPGSG